jgi:hypothetical protein
MEWACLEYSGVCPQMFGQLLSPYFIGGQNYCLHIQNIFVKFEVYHLLSIKMLADEEK